MTNEFNNEMRKNDDKSTSGSRVLLLLVFLLVLAVCLQSYYLYNLSNQIREIKGNPVVGIVEKVITSPLHMKHAPAKSEQEEPPQKKSFVPVAVQKQEKTEQEDAAQVIQSPIPEENLNADETTTPESSDRIVDNNPSQDGIFTQEPNKYVLKFAMPGLDEKSIVVKMKGNSISVSGMLKQQTRSGTSSNIIIQNVYNQFSQTFNVPGDVIKSQIKSSFSKDGTLTIILPREAPVRTVMPTTN